MSLSSDRAPGPKVLVVEDDESQLLALTLGLEREGMSVTGVRSGREALAVHDELAPDLMLLDVVLGGLSGIEVCRELRGRGATTPIIMVSSRSDEMDVVVGIEVGADDYLAKPYRLRELVARIGVLLRRRRLAPMLEPVPAVVGAVGADGAVLVAGDIVLDEDRHEVHVDGRPVELALREFQVLRELLANAGRVVTRDELLQQVWGLDYDGDPRIVSTLVGRLRAHVEPDPREPTRIVTIRGVGYRLDADG
ncbi:MAG: response regulator transcription factor [Actinomycetota bacterium]|nr:response regulator transcription factor [Actinomycetota bacterium]